VWRIRAGAAIVGHDDGLLLITPGFDKHLEVYTPGWLLFVNREGRRFVDETAAYAVMSGVVGSQTGGSCFAIFDEETRAGAEPDPLFRDAFLAGVLPLSWVNSVIDEQVEQGKVLRADSLAELAERAGIDAGALEGTLERYNADCERGQDSAFFKEPTHMRKVATAPFFAAGETTGGVMGGRYIGGGASIANAIVFGKIAGSNAAAHAAGGA